VDIRNKRVMVFGGWGLVGSAICREIIAEEPSKLVVCSLQHHEADDAVAQLHLEFPTTTTAITAEAGNVFVRNAVRTSSRDELLATADSRRRLLADTFDTLDDEMVTSSFVYAVIDRHRPDIIIDAINTASALAYQDVYASCRDVRQAFDEFEEERDVDHLRAVVERNLCTAYVPQLTRHVQILYQAMVRLGTSQYIKIGTSGTGGMGLNVPYTHSEERPSRVLLSKSSLAGAHSLLLFLMARTPGAPIIKELKPTAAIAWKSIRHGPVVAGGEPIRRYDMSVDQAVELGDSFRLLPDERLRSLFAGQGHEALHDVFIDSGENGTFSRAEFVALTTIGQMEFITPEEVAEAVICEIKGGSTGHDVISALDQSSMGPTYRAGAMRQAALAKLRSLSREHDVPSVAFEVLGPPRLSKLLYEAHLLKRIAGSIERARTMSAEDLSARATDLVTTDGDLRSRILSIGIPILMPDGRRLLRGPKVKIPSFLGDDVLPCDQKQRDAWAADGWVDLRIGNFARWLERLAAMADEVARIPFNDTSSRYAFDKTHWDWTGDMDEGKLVAWIFGVEEQGIRVKS